MVSSAMAELVQSDDVPESVRTVILASEPLNRSLANDLLDSTEVGRVIPPIDLRRIRPGRPSSRWRAVARPNRRSDAASSSSPDRGWPEVLWGIPRPARKISGRILSVDEPEERFAEPENGSNRTGAEIHVFRIPPRTPVEEVVASIWSEVLRVEDVGLDDRFLDLGGDSIQATMILSRIEEEFAIRPPLETFFERPTVAALAQAIDQALVEKIEAMSEDEAEAYLEAILQTTAVEDESEVDYAVAG